MKLQMDVMWDTYEKWVQCTICERSCHGLYKIRPLPTRLHTARALIARVCVFCYDNVKEIPDYIPIEQHCRCVKVLIKRLQRERWMSEEVVINGTFFERKLKPSSSKVEQLPVKEKTARSSRA